eukprot:TRINITY_DN36450_c0_g1_i2.p2 TRINITY_DN36450_c0_g1~~TRINITY_DN36450_c0_g1_i2.p2  ORF type:complete len:146 (-),score=9.10 TRINITY_DN36450_c0_g1_i2:133-570(-)
MRRDSSTHVLSHSVATVLHVDQLKLHFENLLPELAPQVPQAVPQRRHIIPVRAPGRAISEPKLQEPIRKLRPQILDLLPRVLELGLELVLDLAHRRVLERRDVRFQACQFESKLGVPAGVPAEGVEGDPEDGHDRSRDADVACRP